MRLRQNLRLAIVGSAQLGPSTIVLVQARQVPRPPLTRRGREDSILLRLVTRGKPEVQPTTHHLGEGRQIHHTIHLPHHALLLRRTTQTFLPRTPVQGQLIRARMLVVQLARLMCPWLRREHQLSVDQRARRVPVLLANLLSSTVQAKTPRLKTTPLPQLLTLHRRTHRRRPISQLTLSHARSPVLRRHPTRLADSSRMAYPSRLQARLVQAATLVRTQQQMLATRTNQQCMPTISLLPLVSKSKKRCPLLYIPLGEPTNTTKAPNRSPNGLSRPLSLRSNGPIRPLNAPG